MIKKLILAFFCILAISNSNAQWNCGGCVRLPGTYTKSQHVIHNGVNYHVFITYETWDCNGDIVYRVRSYNYAGPQPPADPFIDLVLTALAQMNPGAIITVQTTCSKRCAIVTTNTWLSSSGCCVVYSTSDGGPTPCNPWAPPVYPANSPIHVGWSNECNGGGCCKAIISDPYNIPDNLTYEAEGADCSASIDPGCTPPAGSYAACILSKAAFAITTEPCSSPCWGQGPFYKSVQIKTDKTDNQTLQDAAKALKPLIGEKEIKFSDISNLASVTILDSKGATIYHSSNIADTKIDIQTYTDGIYFIRCITKDLTILNIKMLKQK
ncbi:MAG: T9SS type A sorting domain-containing protein [Chitinophagales bacterium]|jgi:TusA-related sulfurtransferase